MMQKVFLKKPLISLSAFLILSVAAPVGATPFDRFPGGPGIGPGGFDRPGFSPPGPAKLLPPLAIGSIINQRRALWVDQPAAYGLPPLARGLRYMREGDHIYVVNSDTARVVRLAAVVAVANR